MNSDPPFNKRRGLSLIETTVATLLVSISLVASLNTMAFVLTTTSRDAHSQQASQLAQFLLTEIVSRPFADADNATGALGIETDETSVRATWDDCDDYHGWNSAIISNLDGVALANSLGWSCAVSVDYCTPPDPNVVSVSPTSLKRINLTLVSPSAQTYSYTTLRCAEGMLLATQMTNTNVLANAEFSLTANGKSIVSAARVQNQQESD